MSPGAVSAPDAAPPLAPRSRAWLAVALVLAGGSLAMAFVDNQRIDWQPGLALQQPWRWWSAAWVHWSPAHLGANLLGMLLVALLGWRARCDRADAAAWLAAWPLTHLALLMQPALLRYGGLSGVLHAGVVVVALALVLRGSGARRSLGAAMLAGVVLKLLLEQPWQGPLQARAGWDIAIAPAAHLSGAIAGAVCAGAAAIARCAGACRRVSNRRGTTS